MATATHFSLLSSWRDQVKIASTILTSLMAAKTIWILPFGLLNFKF